MSTKSYTIIFFLFFVALALVLVSNLHVCRIKDAVKQNVQTERVFENYILASFNATTLQDRALVSEVCQSYLDDAHLVAYLPSGLCHACFSSLLLALQDYDYPWSKVIIISEKEDYEVRAECYARSINYMVKTLSVESVSNILVFRSYRGFFPIVMDYDLSREPILPLFLSDNEKLFHILAGSV